MTFKNILVPHDLQPASDIAFKNAIRIAKQDNDSKITIIHMIEDITGPGIVTAFDRPVYSYRTGEIITPSAYVKEIYHELKNKALKKLEIAKKECENEGISCQMIIESGNPKDIIIKYILDNKVDLVIIGTARRTGISKIKAMGSVARIISENAVCPVILVH
jgi:nucleotide-binding universal stress UspA family protein